MAETDDASLVERVTERLITAVAVGEFLPARGCRPNATSRPCSEWAARRCAPPSTTSPPAG